MVAIMMMVYKVLSKITLIPPHEHTLFVFLIGQKLRVGCISVACSWDQFSHVYFLNEGANDWGEWVHQLLWLMNFL